MKTRIALVSCFALGAFVACGSGDPERNPYLANPRTDAGADSAQKADARQDAGSDAPIGDASGSDAASEPIPDGGMDAQADAPAADRAVPDAAPDSGPTSCALGLTQGRHALLGVSTGREERFGSISDDQLTLAFSVAGTQIEVFVAERAQLSEPFRTPAPVAGDFALDRAALTPDGLSLLVVNRDRRGFTRFSRPARDQAFELDSSSHYAAIVAALGANESLGDPVFALGGQVFLFSQYGGTRMSTVLFANRLSVGSDFLVGAELTNPELSAQGSMRRRPTGVSSDYTTLFFFDEVSNTSKAGSFSGSFEFTALTELGAVSGVQPSGDCSAFYFDAAGDSSRDLFSAR